MSAFSWYRMERLNELECVQWEHDSRPKDKLSLMQTGSSRDTGVLKASQGFTEVNYYSRDVASSAKHLSAVSFWEWRIIVSYKVMSVCVYGTLQKAMQCKEKRAIIVCSVRAATLLVLLESTDLGSNSICHHNSFRKAAVNPKCRGFPTGNFNHSVWLRKYRKSTLKNTLWISRIDILK